MRTIVSDGAGGWFVGGGFRYAAGLPRDGVAHVLGDGSVNPAFKPQTVFLYNGNQTEPSYVTHLALAGTTLYVGGAFNHSGAQERNGLAAFNVKTGEPAGGTRRRRCPATSFAAWR